MACHVLALIKSISLISGTKIGVIKGCPFTVEKISAGIETGSASSVSQLFREGSDTEVGG